MEKINKKIKVMLLVMLSFATLILAVVPSTLADATDTFDITVAGEYIELIIDKESWNVNDGDPVAMNTNYTTSNDYFLADISGSSVNVDLKLQITTDGTDWSAATVGNNPGADTYRLEASTDYFSDSNVQIVTVSATTLESDMAYDPGTRYFDLRFKSPTSTTIGEQQTITVTASVTKH